MQTEPTTSAHWLRGGGDMGELIRRKNWSETPLGPVDGWPQTLKIAVRLLLDTGFPMYVAWGPDLIQLYNDAYRPMLGESKHPFALGARAVDTFPEAWDWVGPAFDRVIQGEAFSADDLLIPLNRNGYLEDCYFTFSYTPLRDETGAVRGILVPLVETTQTVLTRKRLEENQNRLQTVFAQAPVAMAMFETGSDLTFTMANPLYAGLVGRTVDDLIGVPLFEALPEVAGQGFDILLNEVIATGVPYVVSEASAILKRNGQLDTIYVNFIFQPVRDINQTITGVVAIVNDVTAQVLARQKVEARERHLQQVFQQTPTAIGTFYGPAFVIEQANLPLLKFWGVSAEEAIGKPLFAVIPEAAGAGFEELLNSVMKTGEPFIGTEMPAVLRRNGQVGTFYFDFAYSPLTNADGQIDRVILTATEVTEQLQSRRLREESETQFRQLADSMPQMVWVTLPDGYHEYFNQQWYDYTGLSFEQTKADAWANVLHPDDLARTWDVWRNCLKTGDLYQIEYRMRRADGQFRWFLARATPARNEAGEIVRWYGTCTDVDDQKRQADVLEHLVQQRTTDLKRANDDLERSNLDLIQFASVASHDLKEPLRKVRAFGTMLETLLADRLDEQERDLFARMISASGRMQALVDDVLRLSKLSDTSVNVQLTDLNTIINGIRDDLEVTIQERGAVMLVGPLPTLVAVPGQMHQLFQNLISNALKFNTGPQPTVKISAIPNENKADNEVSITVSDNGIGFDAKYKDQIFGMFKRLHGRSAFAGTGIGLTICKKIVDNHRGRIEADSAPGEGTTFTITLPVAVQP